MGAAELRLVRCARDAYREGEGERFGRGERRSGTEPRLVLGAWGLVVVAEVGQGLGVAARRGVDVVVAGVDRGEGGTLVLLLLLLGSQG